MGIYGGSFNPPHTGHVAAVRQAMDLLCLDKLLLIPAHVAPHKQLPEDSATPEQRLAMLRLATAGIANAEISLIEFSREGVSYTYETVQQLKTVYPNEELVLIMGSDMFLTFDTWKNPDVIMSHASLGVLYRGDPGERQQVARKMEEMQQRGAKVYLAENPVLSVSSTDLRRMLIFGCGDSFLPSGVGEYIRENGLYGVGQNYQNLPMEQLELLVKRLLKPNRIAHVMGCRDTAVSLARRWGANETDAARAGILHDITKALPNHLQLTLCRDYGIMLDAFSQQNPKTLHALTGSLVAQRVFGENPEVVSAVRCHTTGKPNMTLLEKIIYVADYMEPNRDFPGVEKLRESAYTDIDEALRLGLTMTLDMLTKQGREISPESKEALKRLSRKEQSVC